MEMKRENANDRHAHSTAHALYINQMEAQQWFDMHVLYVAGYKRTITYNFGCIE